MPSEGDAFVGIIIDNDGVSGSGGADGDLPCPGGLGGDRERGEGVGGREEFECGPPCPDKLGVAAPFVGEAIFFEDSTDFGSDFSEGQLGAGEEDAGGLGHGCDFEFTNDFRPGVAEGDAAGERGFEAIFSAGGGDDGPVCDGVVGWACGAEVAGAVVGEDLNIDRGDAFTHDAVDELGGDVAFGFALFQSSGGCFNAEGEASAKFAEGGVLGGSEFAGMGDEGVLERSMVVQLEVPGDLFASDEVGEHGLGAINEREFLEEEAEAEEFFFKESSGLGGVAEDHSVCGCDESEDGVTPELHDRVEVGAAGEPGEEFRAREDDAVELVLVEERGECLVAGVDE